MSNLKDFGAALRDVYVQDPSAVLPNALWKTIGRLPTFQTCIEWNAEGEMDELRAWDQEGLHVYWNRRRDLGNSLRQITERSRFLIVHDDHFQQLDPRDFKLVKPFFRIRHVHKNISSHSLSSDFYIREADPQRECDAISDLIGRCYEDIHPSPQEVKSWSTNPVFDPSLWIWIMDKQRNAPAALGIAEIDRNVPEGSLEWIQVLPEYQGKGLGKVLVLELLHRLKARADFTTVSGEVDNVTNPERLYRSCGFTGQDVWWLLRN